MRNEELWCAAPGRCPAGEAARNLLREKLLGRNKETAFLSRWESWNWLRPELGSDYTVVRTRVRGLS